MRPLLLDLYCCAGGAARGYQRAGFYVVGIDHDPQPRYAGDKFICGDVFDLFEQYAPDAQAFHASPPCQRYSVITPVAYRGNHPDIIADTRSLLAATGKPYVIENVENARMNLRNPVKLCGSMFGLGVYRHRYFEVYPDSLLLTPACNHSKPAILVTGTTNRRNDLGKRIEYSVKERGDACGIDWMTSRELDEAIPPAYTEYIGRHLLSFVYDQRLTPQMA